MQNTLQNIWLALETQVEIYFLYLIHKSLEVMKIHALNKCDVLIYILFKLEILNKSFDLSLMLLVTMYQEVCFRAFKGSG